MYHETYVSEKSNIYNILYFLREYVSIVAFVYAYKFITLRDDDVLKCISPRSYCSTFKKLTCDFKVYTES